MLRDCTTGLAHTFVVGLSRGCSPTNSSYQCLPSPIAVHLVVVVTLAFSPNIASSCAHRRRRRLNCVVSSLSSLSVFLFTSLPSCSNPPTTRRTSCLNQKGWCIFHQCHRSSIPASMIWYGYRSDRGRFNSLSVSSSLVYRSFCPKRTRSSGNGFDFVFQSFSHVNCECFLNDDERSPMRCEDEERRASLCCVESCRRRSKEKENT